MTDLSQFGPDLPYVLLDLLPGPVFVRDDQLRYVWVNAAFEVVHGKPRSTVIGQKVMDVFQNVTEDEVRDGDRDMLAFEKSHELHQRLPDAQGRMRDYITRRTPLTLPDGSRVIVGVSQDVTDLTDANRELERLGVLLEDRARDMQRLAETDALTGCLNRRALFHRAEAEFTGRDFGIMLMDIDHFKAVNDTFGHDGGDEALKAFVACARQHLRHTDVFARLGGEEFVALIPDIEGRELFAIADRLRGAWANTPLRFNKRRFQSTVSIGVALWPADADLNLDHALAAADRGLYAAKDCGRNRVMMDHAA